MKISVWQQFSSNHSAGFTIIGIFPSTKAASNARIEITFLLDSIAEWHRTNPREADRVTATPDISPVEREFATRFHLDWTYPVLWNSHRVVVYGQFLIITNWLDADSGAAPIHKLIERLGGEALVHGDIVWNRPARDVIGEVTFEIECEAPSIDIAREVASATGGDWDETSVLININLNSDSVVEINAELPRILKILQERNCHIVTFKTTQTLSHHIQSGE